MPLSVEDFKRAFSSTVSSPELTEETPDAPPPSTTPYRVPSDPGRTMGVLTRLRDLTLRAEAKKLTLKGKLPALRQIVIKAMDVDDYKKAETALTGIDKALVQAEKAYAKWDGTEAMNFAITKVQVTELGTFAAPEAGTLQRAVQGVEQLVKDEDFPGAVTAAKALAAGPPKVADLQGMYPGRGDWAGRARKIVVTIQQVEDLVGWQTAGAEDLKKRLVALQVDATDEKGKYGSAVTAFDSLEGEVEIVHKPLRDEKDAYSSDRGPAETAAKTVLDHVEVAAVTTEAQAIQKLLDDAATHAGKGEYAQANTLLAKIHVDVVAPKQKADQTATNRARSLGKKVSWADAKITALESLLGTQNQACKQAYQGQLTAMKNLRDSANTKLTLPSLDFEVGDAEVVKVFHGCTGAIDSVATFATDHPAYALARPLAVTAISGLKSHAQASAIDAEIKVMEQRLKGADSLGQSKDWKKATVAVKQIPTLCADVKTLADSLVTTADQLSVMTESLKTGGMSDEDAAEIAGYAHKILAGEGCDNDKAIKMAKAAKVYMRSGLSETDALMSARAMQSLIDDGVEEGLAKAVGENVRGGGTAKANDVKALAKTVAGLPRSIIDNFNTNGINNVVCRDTVTDLCPELSGVQPRGWPVGDTWDKVPGVYQGSSKRVVATTFDNSGDRTIPGPGQGPNPHSACDLVGHEAGHGFDVSDPGPKKNENTAFRQARESDKTRAATQTPHGLVGGTDNYYLTTTEGGANTAGAIPETFAESCAQFTSNKVGAWPALKTFWQNNPWT